MRRIITKRRLLVQMLAVVLAVALNLGALDGIIRYAVQEWEPGTWAGFLSPAEAGERQAEKGKNFLPDSAGPKKHLNAAAEEARENREIKEKRTPNSKTYRIGANEYRTEVFSEPIHYANERNELVDIDNTLVESKDKDYTFENAANSFKVFFTDKTNNAKLGRIQQQGITLKWHMPDALEASGTAARNSMTYNEIRERTDLRYIIDGSTLKEDIILKSREAPAEFRFVLDMKGLRYENRTDGSIIFRDSRTNEVVWVMPKPYMYDAKGARSEAVTAVLKYKWGRQVFTVTADREWLDAPDRQFPVVIDPTLQPGERFGRDTFISSAQPETNFNSAPCVYVGNAPDYGETIGFFFFRDIDRKENMQITGASFSLYAQDGSLSSAELREVGVDWLWDYSVLTWEYWQGRIALGHQVWGDFTATAGGSNNGWWTYDIKDLVQKWVDNPVKNTGFALLADGSGYRKFISSNYGTSEADMVYHPKLEYTYTIGPSPGPADFTLSIDRKTGSVTVAGTAREDAEIHLATSDGDNYTTDADESGAWEIGGLTFDNGEIKEISMYYTYEVEVTDAKATLTPRPGPVRPPADGSW